MIAQSILPSGPFIHRKRNVLTKSTTCFLYSVYMNLWFIILKVQSKKLKKSNSRSNEFQLYKNLIYLIAACAHLKDSLWITFKKLHKLFFCLPLFQGVPNSLANGQPSERTTDTVFSVTTILVILWPSRRVL